jgi:hypothetical protein
VGWQWDGQIDIGKIIAIGCFIMSMLIVVAIIVP